jgi:hypothetical protein
MIGKYRDYDVMSLTIQIWERFFFLIIHFWCGDCHTTYHPSNQSPPMSCGLFTHTVLSNLGAVFKQQKLEFMPINFSLLTYCWLSHLKEYFKKIRKKLFLATERLLKIVHSIFTWLQVIPAFPGQGNPWTSTERLVSSSQPHMSPDLWPHNRYRGAKKTMIYRQVEEGSNLFLTISCP